MQMINESIFISSLKFVFTAKHQELIIFSPQRRLKRSETVRKKDRKQFDLLAFLAPSRFVFILEELNEQLCTMQLRHILLPVFLLLSLTTQAQLVNIESKRMQTDSIRFVLRGDLSGSYTDNNGNYIYLIRSSLTTQLKSKDLRKTFFVLGDYNLIRSGDQDFNNSWFAHLRFNYKLTKLFRLEAFVQSQRNKILDVNYRNLIGAGIRLKLISKENAKLYWGHTYMYEEEVSDVLNKQFYFHRHSTYLSMSASFAKDIISLTNTLYYQPLYADFSDFRILEQFKTNVAVTEKLSFFTLLDYFYDSFTPQERKQFSSKFSVGIGIRL